MTGSKTIRAAYTGTFDPITYGHADVIRRAARLFPEVIVAVANNSSKKAIFTAQERLALARRSLEDVDNIRVTSTSGLIVDFARENGVSVLVRGVRNVGDYEYEMQMASMNRHLVPNVDTVFLSPSPEYSYISSTLVREIAMLQGDITGLVPPVVAQALATKSR